MNIAQDLRHFLHQLAGIKVSHATSNDTRYSRGSVEGNGFHGRISGDIFSGGMRGVISTSGDICRSDTLYFFPMASRLATTLENFGREEGCSCQHRSMIWVSSFVHM